MTIPGSREDQAVLKAAINLAVPKKHISTSRPSSHREYRGVTVEIYGKDVRLPTGSAMELAKYLANHQFKGRAYFMATPETGEFLSGVRVLEALPNSLSIKISFWKEGTGAFFYLQCEPQQYEEICARLEIDRGIKRESIFDKQYTGIMLVRIVGEKPYEFRKWSESTKRTVIENIKLRAKLVGTPNFRQLRDVIAVTFGIHPDSLGENGGRSIYHLTVLPMVKAGLLSKTAQRNYVLIEDRRPVDLVLPELPLENDTLTEKVVILIGESQAAKRKLKTLEAEHLADSRIFEDLQRQAAAIETVQMTRRTQIINCKTEIDRIKKAVNELMD